MHALRFRQFIKRIQENILLQRRWGLCSRLCSFFKSSTRCIITQTDNKTILLCPFFLNRWDNYFLFSELVEQIIHPLMAEPFKKKFRRQTLIIAMYLNIISSEVFFFISQGLQRKGQGSHRQSTSLSGIYLHFRFSSLHGNRH